LDPDQQFLFEKENNAKYGIKTADSTKLALLARPMY